MSSSVVVRALVTLLAFVMGCGLTYLFFEAIARPVDESGVESAVEGSSPGTGRIAIPDPLGRRSSPASSLGFVAVLIVIGVGAFWLGRRRALEPDLAEEPEPEGPHLIFERRTTGRRRAPEFYEDLRQRETTLESLETRGPEGERRKVIELPVGNQRPTGNPRSSGH